jgi:hypothetical protein
VVEVQNIARCVGEFGASVVIGVVRVGNHGVDAVVAAIQRGDHQDTGALGQRPVVGRAHQVGPADR